MGIMEKFEGRLERQAQLMCRMMAQLGVDQERAAQDRLGLDMARATRACMFCRHSDACARWLEAASDDACETAPSFCRNRDFFGMHGLQAN